MYVMSIIECFLKKKKKMEIRSKKKILEPMYIYFYKVPVLFQNNTFIHLSILKFIAIYVPNSLIL